MLVQLKQNLLKAQARMKMMANNKRTKISFTKGEWVFVKLQPYRQHSLPLRKKSEFWYVFPFKNLQKIGIAAYKFQLPPKARLHPIFHVSLLKKCINDSQTLLQ